MAATTRRRTKGAVAARVSANIRAVRRKTTMTTYDLATRFGQLGVPVVQSFITRIETGTRDINVDDLMVTALALGTTPNRLLLPDLGVDGAGMEVTAAGEVTATGGDLWAWATGERPLIVRDRHAVPSPQFVQQATFVVDNQQHHYAKLGISQVVSGATGGTLTMLRALAAEAIAAGVSPDMLVGHFTRAVEDAVNDRSQP